MLYDNIRFPGDYSLSKDQVEITTATGQILPVRMGTITELSIFEDIESSALTGAMTIIDSSNIISKTPLQGNERLAFKLSTPVSSDSEDVVIDASEETGSPFRIYAITDRHTESETTMTYTIHFCSREFLRSTRTRVSKAYDGPLHQTAIQILRDETGLDSLKNFTYEPTRNSDKIVIPNMRPLDAITMLCDKALSKNTNGAGYYFYETTKGFHLQSWENMCAKNATSERDTIQQFFYMPQNITDDKIDEPKELQDLKSVESYKFINTFHDTAAAQALGTYGHRVIMHNLYAKDFKQTDYHYHDQFNQTVHADYEFENGLSQVAPAIRDNPVDFDVRPDGKGKGVSDYAESLVSLLPTTQFLHNENTGSYGTDVSDDARLEGVRNSIEMQVQAGTTIQMTVKGQTYIQPGHVIDFAIRPVEPEGRTRDDKPYDPQYSGRYIITKMRHRVTKQDYKMVLEVKKDSVREPLLGRTIPNFTGTANNENAQYQKIDT